VVFVDLHALHACVSENTLASRVYLSWCICANVFVDLHACVRALVRA
jgi:hypothetical protein